MIERVKAKNGKREIRFGHMGEGMGSEKGI